MQKRFPFPCQVFTQMHRSTTNFIKEVVAPVDYRQGIFEIAFLKTL